MNRLVLILMVAGVLDALPTVSPQELSATFGIYMGMSENELDVISEGERTRQQLFWTSNSPSLKPLASVPVTNNFLSDYYANVTDECGVTYVSGSNDYGSVSFEAFQVLLGYLKNRYGEYDNLQVHSQAGEQISDKVQKDVLPTLTDKEKSDINQEAFANALSALSQTRLKTREALWVWTPDDSAPDNLARIEFLSEEIYRGGRLSKTGGIVLTFTFKNHKECS